MRKVEIITKAIALERFKEVEEEALLYSKSYNKVMQEIAEPACIEFMKYAPLLQLKIDEVCVFVDGEPAEWITPETVLDNRNVVGKMCFKNIVSANFENELLVITFDDKTKEYYKQDEHGYFKIVNPIGNN